MYTYREAPFGAAQAKQKPEYRLDLVREGNKGRVWIRIQLCIYYYIHIYI